MEKITNHVEQKNEVICHQLQAIQTEIDGLESLLEAVKTKKETYLDSLIPNQFVAKEREMINAKIDEFTIQEKQFKGNIMKQQFESTQKEDQFSSVESLKKELVFFKINSQSLGTNELKKWLLANVYRVDISKDETVSVKFKSVDLSVSGKDHDGGVPWKKYELILRAAAEIFAGQPPPAVSDDFKYF